MREIKFMLFDVKLNDWVCYGLRDIPKNRDYIWIRQFTGLLDKNGKEIYEGDIVNIKSLYETDEPIDENTDVVFRDGRFVTNFHALGINRKTVDGSRNWEMKVIGNIYSNPELLK